MKNLTTVFFGLPGRDKLSPLTRLLTRMLTEVQSKASIIFMIFILFQEIGLGLLAFGAIFILFGIMLLFDTGLMIIGNVLAIR